MTNKHRLSKKRPQARADVVYRALIQERNESHQAIKARQVAFQAAGQRLVGNAADVPQEFIDISELIEMHGDRAVSDRERNRALKYAPPGTATSPYSLVISQELFSKAA